MSDNRGPLVKALTVLRAKLPPAVRHGLEHDLISLFAMARVANDRARAVGVSAPAELLAGSDDPAIVTRAVTGLAVATSPGWAEEVRHATGVGDDEPLVGVGIIYATRESASDRVRIAMGDVDGNGYLLRDSAVTVYPFDTSMQDLTFLGRESSVLYLSTLILASLIAGSTANQRAEMQLATRASHN